MNLCRFDNQNDFIQTSANAIAEVFRHGGSLALSGGSTPKPVYEALSGRDDIDFSKLHIYEVDERLVPATDPDSNRGMIEQALINPIGTIGGWHFFDTSLDIETSLQQYEAEVKAAVPFDMAVMGIGSDGHTASLFRKGSALHEEERLVTNTHTYEFSVYERLTLTFPAIMESKKILLLVSGKKKQDIFDQLLHADIAVDDFPAKKLLEHPDLTIHYCEA